MKYLLLIVVLAAAVVAALVMVTPGEGNPLAELELPWQVDEQRGHRDSDGGGDAGRLHSDDQQDKLYRWRSDDGSWSYGNVPPPGVDAEAVELSETQRFVPDPPARDEQP